jgi:hypothetical protein
MPVTSAKNRGKASERVKFYCAAALLVVLAQTPGTATLKLLFLINSYWLSRPTFDAGSPTDSNRDQLAQTQMID